MPANETDPATETPSPLPLELELVHEVKQCRACKWFWGPPLAYGPFTAFDYPDGSRLPPVPADPSRTHERAVPWAEMRAAGSQAIEPSILHGCRKAPIMTIGINPNMTAFYASSTGATWCYPHFRKEADYAFYYRYRTIYQESVARDSLAGLIVQDSEVRARTDGRVVEVQRGDAHCWMLITLAYDADGAEVQERIELTWDGEERYVMLRDRNDRFRKGDLVAARIRIPDGEPIAVTLNAVSYYQRYQTVLDRVSAKIGDGIALSIGEDCSQHDMVACPSPGWNQQRFDMPVDWIEGQCVTVKRYLLRQLVQSRPALICVSGSSTLAMLLDILAPFVQPDGDALKKALRDSDLDVFALMKELVERPRRLKVAQDGWGLDARLVVSPHFSYDDNFQPLCRMPKPIWEGFRQQFPTDVALLEQASLIDQRTGVSGERLIHIDKAAADLKGRCNATAWRLMELFYYDSYQLLADAIAQEIDQGKLALDRSSGRLRRAAGACHFCDNDHWQLPGGCIYGSDNQASECEHERGLIQYLLRNR